MECQSLDIEHECDKITLRYPKVFKYTSWDYLDIEHKCDKITLRHPEVFMSWDVLRLVNLILVVSYIAMSWDIKEYKTCHAS